MKVLLAVLTLFLGCVTTHAQDAHFEYYSPFGSDGTNQPGLTPQMRNACVFDDVWGTYAYARKQIDQPLPKEHPSGYSQADLDHSTTTFRYGHLLETMVEFRAFTTQNKGYANEAQKAEVARIDKVLRALNLHYYLGCSQAMIDFCDKMGAGKIRHGLAPVLLNDDGSPRPISSK